MRDELDDLRKAFERDWPFTADNEALYDTETAEVVWSEGMTSKRFAAMREDKRYVYIDAISHGEWHQVFRDFLCSFDALDTYEHSIGRTLKKLDDGSRFAWYEWKAEYASRKADEFETAMNRGKAR
jgi:hypothetical protein